MGSNSDLDRTVRYWLDGAAYDLDTGAALLDAKRYPYALFFGHLAIEKLLKAMIVRATGEHAPFSHSLTLLAGKIGIPVTEQILDRLAEFNEFHIESRYPDDRKDFYTRCTEVFAREKFNELHEVYQWLMQL
jgi:HEPN domain-containing protein